VSQQYYPANKKETGFGRNHSDGQLSNDKKGHQQIKQNGGKFKLRNVGSQGGSAKGNQIMPQHGAANSAGGQLVGSGPANVYRPKHQNYKGNQAGAGLYYEVDQ
jgi:hypothetical protein